MMVIDNFDLAATEILHTRVEPADVGFPIWRIEKFFKPLILNQLIIELAKHPYKHTDGDRTVTDGDRIWCHRLPGVMEHVSKQFASARMKQILSDITGVDYTGMSTRIELCMDSSGSWLRSHVDDKAKHLTLQLYLTDGGKSTLLGSDQVTSRLNSGWMFVNTGTEFHELPPLAANRASIILNYVDSSWNDRSVLVEG